MARVRVCERIGLRSADSEGRNPLSHRGFDLFGIRHPFSGIDPFTTPHSGGSSRRRASRRVPWRTPVIISPSEIQRSLRQAQAAFPHFSDWEHNNEVNESYSGFALWGEFVSDPKDPAPGLSSSRSTPMERPGRAISASASTATSGRVPIATMPSLWIPRPARPWRTRSCASSGRWQISSVRSSARSPNLSPLPARSGLSRHQPNRSFPARGLDNHTSAPYVLERDT